MSVTINGLKSLEANDYERIIIREKNGKYQIDVKPPKNKIKTSKANWYLSNDLNGKTAEEKIVLIIDSFLRNTKINYVHNNKYLSHYDGKFSGVTGTRELYFQLFTEKLGNIPKMLMDKYFKDRLEFCVLNNAITSYNIWSTSRTSSYERVDANYGSSITFHLLQKNGKLANFEKKFLADLIEEKLYESGEKANLERKIVDYEETGTIDFGYFLTCGNLIMRLREQIIVNEVTEVVNKYNKERETVKKMQLKLEGF